ncbi:YD repeat-containing protein [Treponema pedis str. T A4]|uniref:YD repeat-containing protein n=1 Tax=Treponema pedis str. T A4 TaxID=1291379 RepID=S5ZNG4_9SPIR|nr:RHS repeat-associated core domain-containing protein [Treponema pedis]AGT44107.1 YD repeat-containing protein [Treponema pedis str. T A4]
MNKYLKDEEEFIFTYNYDKESGVYSTDYGFGLDAPKETKQTNPQDLFAYRRNYTYTYKSKTAKLFLATYNNFLAKQPSGLTEEAVPGIDKLLFRFTGKEFDEEPGLYHYGARYLDPKYSRWLSGDPALNDYIPKAPVNDEAKKHNENLPGMGGVYNTVNLHLYHYAGNNPVKYTDPDGRSDEYTIDGDYIGHINDNIDGIHVVEFTYVGSATSRKDSHGYLKNQDGSIMSASDFNNIVALIFSEAKLANGVN